MSESQSPAINGASAADKTPTPATENHAEGYGTAALVTTGIVSALVAFSASVLFQHYFQKLPEVTMPIAVVDMVQIGAEITKAAATGGDTQTSLAASGERIAQLKAAGYIVLDARNVITAPDQYIVPTTAFVPNASNTPNPFAGYAPGAQTTLPKEASDNKPSFQFPGH